MWGGICAWPGGGDWKWRRGVRLFGKGEGVELVEVNAGSFISFFLL